jgi:NADH:ubiquinone oxidoreductase subunit K
MNPALEIGLYQFLIVSFLLVAAGVATMLTKRNAIGILIGVELVLNAANINLVAFNRYAWPGQTAPTIDGQMFATFVVVLAAAEAAVALAIFLNFYNTFKTIDVDKAQEIKG